VRRAVTLLFALTLVLLAGCSSTGDDNGTTAVLGADPDGYHGTVVDPPWPASAQPLESDEGAQVRLDQQDKELRLVFFGYTNCPDICQVVMSTMASAVTRLPDDERAKVQGVFITTDPARDTPAVLKDYVDRFDPDFVGLTGSLEDIVAVAEEFHIFVEKGQKLPSGGYEVSHGTQVIAVQDGGGTLVWDAATSPSEMAADIEKLLKEDR
jgi:protein SCO1/2